jgi:hypothetical protein
MALKGIKRLQDCGYKELVRNHELGTNDFTLKKPHNVFANPCNKTTLQLD